MMKGYLTGNLKPLQSILSFEGWAPNTQFTSEKGLGRVAMQACILGMLWGIHAILALILMLYQKGILALPPLKEILKNDRAQMLCLWSVYVVMLCTFHLLEFFTTAIYNPSVTSAESFLINHSLMYTAALLSSSIEFWIRFLFVPSFLSTSVTIFGLCIVLLAQTVRSLAMATCGESFNHRIQTYKKDNHVLISHGIYAYLRHPSYFGFYYWSIGTQLLLNNPIHSLVFAGASAMFFRKRIPYEEESLQKNFGEEYAKYRSQTWIGIPFVSVVDLKKES